jgi:transcriptional regulator with XRE-family HTH domain
LVKIIVYLQYIMHKLMDVANNIRNTRIHRNYTQDYLAAKLKISQNAYSKIELGRTKVTVEKLLIIADVLNTNACDLINIKAQ